MPFIEQSRRQPMLDGSLADVQPGDRCFRHYHRMMAAWKAERRWTTAHKLYKDMLMRRAYMTMDESVSEELAWQVFFTLHVMPYEREKQEANGDI